MLKLKLRYLFALVALLYSAKASSNFDHYSDSLENVMKHQDKSQSLKVTSFKEQMKNVKDAVGIPSSGPIIFTGPRPSKSDFQTNGQELSSHTRQTAEKPQSTQLFQRGPGQSTNNVIPTNGKVRQPTQTAPKPQSTQLFQRGPGQSTNNVVLTNGQGREPTQYAQNPQSTQLFQRRPGQSNSNNMNSIYGQQEMDENMGYPKTSKNQYDMPTVEGAYTDPPAQIFYSTDSVNGDEIDQIRGQQEMHHQINEPGNIENQEHNVKPTAEEIETSYAINSVTGQGTNQILGQQEMEKDNGPKVAFNNQEYYPKPTAENEYRNPKSQISSSTNSVNENEMSSMPKDDTKSNDIYFPAANGPNFNQYNPPLNDINSIQGQENGQEQVENSFHPLIANFEGNNILLDIFLPYQQI